MADNEQTTTTGKSRNAAADTPVTPEVMVRFMRGNAKIDVEGDKTPEQDQVFALMSEMRVQADELGYDLSGKVSAIIEGERCQLTWSFNRLEKGAK